MLFADGSLCYFYSACPGRCGRVVSHATPAIYKLHMIGRPGNSKVPFSSDLTDQLSYFPRSQVAIIVVF